MISAENQSVDSNSGAWVCNACEAKNSTLDTKCHRCELSKTDNDSVPAPYKRRGKVVTISGQQYFARDDTATKPPDKKKIENTDNPPPKTDGGGAEEHTDDLIRELLEHSERQDREKE